MAHRRGRHDPLGLEALGGRPPTIDDLGRLPDDGYRYEIDEGLLVVSAAPANHHQVVSSRLHVFLGNACPPSMMVLATPGLAISAVQFRVPDLVVVRGEDTESRYLERPPLLVVEIASPSTERYDRSRKKEVYADFGIPDYWIVTPDREKPDVTVFQLSGRKYEQADYIVGEATLTTKRPFPVAFTPSALVVTGQR
ncbi:MAG TPA: Uma2 family endonuclease [Trebonia sp.]|nr:Uma2 family endonuclease [Trebonia sp.]